MLIIFGGTFDPIHLGHLEIAKKVHEIFDHNITFMPTGIPPYKANPTITSTQRLEMLHIAIDKHPYFSLDTTEISQHAYCYTYKSLNFLRKKFGDKIPIYFIIGSDSFINFDTWDNWQEILNYSSLIVITRKNYNQIGISKTLEAFAHNRYINNVDEFKTHRFGKIFTLSNFTPKDISSTQIRNNIKNNLDFKEFVTLEVYDYIISNHLYTKL